MVDLRLTMKPDVGTRAARLRAIFRFPEKIHGGAEEWTGTRDPLAYVEWYSKFSPVPDKFHKMYSVSRLTARTDGTYPGKIIPLSQIRQCCQLTPHFGTDDDSIPKDWTSDTVLDLASQFWLNNWTSMYAYQTVW